ncbi:hypothetical protein [Algicella marina]|uniref:Lipoprotein n=1 Tax=Algicella marina TaxID=2683284 RepID=A0A6P1T0K5_9RHOB|nr:hypothetical protein [Algicella marina]QHQ34966.1 hypothetical protein GO499_07025 [Algicella marina]
MSTLLKTMPLFALLTLLGACDDYNGVPSDPPNENFGGDNDLDGDSQPDN